MELKKISNDDLYILPVDEGLNEAYRNRVKFIFENETQLIEVEKDTEGYDYESQIHENAL
ncbi:MAG: hypothetical protein OEV07_01135 [Gammaproteobacteria bacterium]|nr:hypothetical protein [Gammaproteobacteria bacterium]